MGIKGVLNGKERDADEWAELFQKAGPGFKLVGISRTTKSRLALIQVEWTGSEDKTLNNLLM